MAPVGWLQRSWDDHGVRGLLFLAVGASAAAFNWLSFLLFHERWGVEPHIASVAASEASILWGFLAHSLVTFRTVVARHSLARRFLTFHGVVLVGIVVTLIAFTVLHDGFGVAPRWAQLLALPVATPFNYLGQRYITWRTRAT